MELKGNKKFHVYTTFGKIKIIEPIFRSQRSNYVRIVANLIKIKARGCSIVFQQRIADFGAEESFEKASRRIKEHYGVEIPASAVRSITQKHAAKMKENADKKPIVRTLGPSGKKIIVTQIDGTMLPFVNTYEKDGDKRKGRNVEWKEARLAAAWAEGSIQPLYGVTPGDDVEKAGNKWAQVTKEAGWGLNTQIHAIADGAVWIANQSKIQFRQWGKLLLDYYHLSDYLWNTAQECVDPSEQKRWFSDQQKRLKHGEVKKVFQALKSLSKPANAAQKTYQYMFNRRKQLHYKWALDNGLPIGSGMIESGHRHVLQKRLKKSGTWWLPCNGWNMAELCVVRANNQWDAYWATQLAVA